MKATQGGKLQVNFPAARQAVAQLLEVINEVTEELNEEEEDMDEAGLLESVEEIIEDSPELSQWLVQSYQPEVWLAEGRMLWSKSNMRKQQPLL